ncbi:MAG: FHA domain-containing protein [Gloeotrichia echinulata HAB0833]
MSITCQACGYDENPPGSEYCGACGSELTTASTTPNYISEVPTIVLPPEPNQFSYQEPIENPPPIITPIYPDSTPTISASTAKLISKLPNSPIPEFHLDGSNAIVGRFDTDSGPVEVDLEGFPGEDTVSRAHAEIYYEIGQWKIKDIGSTNGVFIKRAGQSRFSARITTPETLNSGDEIAFGKIRFLFQSS